LIDGDHDNLHCFYIAKVDFSCFDEKLNKAAVAEGLEVLLAD